jgi:hypothetical protein
MPIPAMAVVTLAPLTLGPTIDSRTISMWYQIAFSAGSYPVGGVPAGVAAAVSALTIDDTQYLGSHIEGEDTVVLGGGSLPTVGGIVFKYIPSTDKIQLFDFQTGLELQSSETIPPAVLNDTIVGEFTYNRL